MQTDSIQTSSNGNGTSQSSSPERLQDAASGILDQAGRTAETQASKTMDKASETLEQVARAVRESGNQLRTERPEIAGFADTAAQRVEQASTYLRQHDAREVVAEAERIARRQPVLVVGGGLLLGLALGRFLRSGAEPMNNTTGRQFGAGGATGWSGGTADQYPTEYAGSTLSSRSAGASSSPSSGYGTGYGASYAPSTTADNLTTTDAVADDMLSTGSGASTTRSTSSRKATTGTSSTRKSRSSGAE